MKATSKNSKLFFSEVCEIGYQYSTLLKMIYKIYLVLKLVKNLCLLS